MSKQREIIIRLRTELLALDIAKLIKSTCFPLNYDEATEIVIGEVCKNLRRHIAQNIALGNRK